MRSNGGGECVNRHPARITANPNTLMPTHLCQLNMRSSNGLMASSVIVQPKARAHTINPAISQCNAIAVRVQLTGEEMIGGDEVMLVRNETASWEDRV
jgi:hypothetical protein